MYTASFGLRCAPFEDRADAAFFFPATQQEEAIAAMQYEAQHGEGVGLVLGETGTGKTILMRALSRRLSDAGKVAVLTVPGNGAVDILRESCKAFGVSLPSSVQDVRGLARLRRHLVRHSCSGGSPTLIIDQAEHLSPGDLMDVESLLELKDDRGRLLRIVLAAHIRFHALLAQPAFTKLRQLAFTEHRLGSLSESEVAQYIRHRLNVAGAAGGEYFSAEAIARISEKSGGIPRVINQLCNAAMLAAYGAGTTHVTLQHIEETSGAAGTSAISRTLNEFENSSATSETAEFRAASWSDQGGQYDETVSAVADRLASLLQRAERTMDGLHRRELKVVTAIGQSEGQIDQAIDSARERILTLESKLSAATRRAEQAANQIERAEQVFVRAEQLETRLAAFADQLAEQMDNMQARVAEIMTHAAPLDDARKGLEDAVRQSEAARAKMEQASSRANAIYLEQKEEFVAELQKAKAASFETVSKKVRGLTETFQKEVSGLLEQSTQSVKRLVTDGQQSITEAVQKALAKIDVSARLGTEQVAQAEKTSTEMHDAVQAGKRAIHEASQKAEQAAEELNHATELAKQEAHSVQQSADRIRMRTTEEMKQAAEQAMAETQNAYEAAERIRTLHRESVQVAARIAADTAAARGVCENVVGLISSADAKVGQLASTHAAANHLHERLAKLVLTAHPMTERAQEAVEKLHEQLGASENAQSQSAGTIREMTSKLAEIVVQIDRVDHSVAEAETRSKNLQDAARNAGEIQHELETTALKASAEIISLRESITQSSELMARAESINHTLAETIQSSTDLAGTVASAKSITQEFRVLLEAAADRETSLSEKSEAMKELVVFHEKARRDAADASQRMAEHLQSFHNTLHASEGKLQEQRQRMDALEKEILQVTDRAGAAQEVASQVQTVVENAQAQSENLERVCVAVRKVFSGLSQASLNARKQAQELEHFVIQASQTADTIQQWFEQVRARIEHVTEVQMPHSNLAKARHADPFSGTLECEGEMLVEDEPGAANAHLVSGGLTEGPSGSLSSRAREIELLIEKARQSKAAVESELELASRPD